MGKSSSVTIGHNYFMGLHMGLCRGPVDEIVEIKVGDKTAWKYNPDAPNPPSDFAFQALRTWKRTGGAATTAPSGLARVAYNFTYQDHIEWNEPITGNTSIRIKAKELFGGEESEGGIDGFCDVMMGAPDQGINTRLAQMLGGLVPAFRGRVTLFFDGLITAMSKYPKPWAFRVRRALNGWDGGVWYPEKCVIWLNDNKIRAMNGAHVVYESMTNRDWGRGFARAKLNEASFIAAADQLYSEGFGLCYRWGRQDNIKNFLRDMLLHIGANIFIHRTTGLWTVQLVRGDYDTEDLPLFDSSSGLLGFEEDDNAATVVSTNEVIVNYIRPEDGSEGSVRVQNIAAIRAAGGPIPETVDYPALPTAELALRVAQRDLRAKFGVKKFKVKLDRRGYQIIPGSVFRISAPERGINQLVLRVVEMDDGKIDSGTMVISAVMDVFGLPSNSFVSPQPSLWTPPNIYPQPVLDSIFGEATYRDLAANLDAARFNDLTPGTNLVTSIAGKPTSLSVDYQLNTRVGTANWKSSAADFSPTAELSDAIQKTNDRVTVTLTNMVNIDIVQPGTAAVMNGEIFRVDALDESDGFCMLARGCIDTVPVEHAAGSTIYFYQDYLGVDQTEYANGVTVEGQLLSRTGTGILDVDLAPVETHTVNRRRERPYPPGKVTLNSTAYPDWINGLLNLSYAHRDRVTQADQLIDQSIGSVGPEAGVYYDLVIKGEGNTELVNTVTTATSYLVSESEEFKSGAVDYADGRDLRVVGVGVVSSTLATSLVDKFVNKIESGWMQFTSTKGDFIDGATGAITTRNRSIAWANDTKSTVITRNSAAYLATIAIDSDGNVTDYDNYVGYAIAQYQDSLGNISEPGVASDQPTFRLIRDRRLNAKCVVGLTIREASLQYWASTYENRRAIFAHQFRLHVATKAAVVTGPMTSVGHTISSFYRTDPAQFDSASGSYLAYNPSVTGRMPSGYLGSPQVFSRLSIIFGGLLYVPHLAPVTVINTAGKPVNITNILSSHIDCATALGDKTAIYTIDLDGNISLLTTRDGLVLADEVNATTGVEIVDGTIKTVNKSTGVLGGTIATIPSSKKALAVVGDTVSETFYVLADNGVIYRYDLSGTLLANITMPVFYGLTSPQQLELTSGYLYYFPKIGISGQEPYTYRINKDLSAFSTFKLADVTGLPTFTNTGAEPYTWTVVASPSSGQFFARKLLDDSGSSTSIPSVNKPRINDTLTIELGSVRDGLNSHQKHMITTKRFGWGLRWDEYWS